MRIRLRAEDGWPGHGIIFSIGFFGLAAQTLLFRSFLTVFEGNELGIAWFFGSWLLWVSAGACLANRRWAIPDTVCNYFEFLPLLYIPAYLLQYWLIVNSRRLAGIQAFELFPLAEMLPVSLLANAPVSFCTGLFFTLACQWMSKTQQVPVARVYILESIGGFVGGGVVTLLLALKVPSETVFLWAALLLSVTSWAFRSSKGAWNIMLVPLLIILTVLFTGLNNKWTRANDLRSWQRLLPGESYRGSFSTPQAGYLYGEYRGQFNVIARESIADSIPSTEHASQVIALHLAQNPDARKFLIIGPGSFSICKRLLGFPRAEQITWLDTDPDYPRNLLKVLPEQFKDGVDRLEIPGTDIHRYLRSHPRKYDLVILNLPDAVTLALNRYFTREFFQLLQKHLTESGIIGVRVSAGENFMGDELVNTGATIFHTLESVFNNVTVKPGTESWLIASDSDRLSALPGELKDRFGAVPGADALYPPDGLMSLYLPDRISYQVDGYRDAVEKSAEGMLLNTDRQPRALLHSLLFAAREAGTTISLTGAIKTFAASGKTVVPMGVCLYFLLRLVYWFNGGNRRDSGATRRSSSSFDIYVLVFSAGAVGMAVNIVLMFMYQSVFGSIFLHVGLISALFMLGLSAGSIAAERLLLRSGKAWAYLLFAGTSVHAIFMAGICLLSHETPHVVFGIMFVLAGLFSGLYVPIAASRLKEAKVPHRQAGASVELNDHLGGAVGGVMTGLVLLPVFGSTWALGIMAAFLAVNFLVFLPADIGPAAAAEAGDRFRKIVRPAGYVMFGLAGFLMLSSVLLQRAGLETLGHSFRTAVKTMSNSELVEKHHSSAQDPEFDYFVSLDDSGAVEKYFLSSEKLAGDITGYGGTITMAVMIDGNGVLQDFRIIQSYETPAYLAFLRPWLKDLAGKKLFGKNPLDDVDSVTGATLTSSAIRSILRETGRSFAGQVLNMDVAGSAPQAGGQWPDKRFLSLVVLGAAALALRRSPSRRRRRLFLMLVVLVMGVLFNIQYSLAHTLFLLGLRLPPVVWNDAILLVLVVPVFVLLFGNVYCGYLCPFGALQELIGDLRPGALATDPDKAIWRYGRVTKYILLFAVVIMYAMSSRAELASHDPLVTVFGMGKTRFVIVITACILVLSFPFKRFWCRNLCPAGAFLSLLNGIHLLRRFIPDVACSFCDFGVMTDRDLDCLCCDRCRRIGPANAGQLETVESSGPGRILQPVFFAAVFILAFSFLQATMTTWRAEKETIGARHGVPGAGRTRNVDMRRLRKLIERRSLSAHEAQYYTDIPDAKEPQPR